MAKAYVDCRDKGNALISRVKPNRPRRKGWFF
jgi:hypothetical protein